MPDADATDNAKEKWGFSVFQQGRTYPIRDSICKLMEEDTQQSWPLLIINLQTWEKKVEQKRAAEYTQMEISPVISLDINALLQGT